jgi:hypothetical protein
MVKNKKNSIKRGFLRPLFKWIGLCFLLASVFLVFFAFSSGFLGSFLKNFRAAVGYGCGQYGISATYNNDCPDPLVQSDLVNLNTLVGIINCTPDPINATTTTTCSGTLPVNYSPPSGILNMRVDGGSNVTCSFLGNTFTCGSMIGVNVIGPAVNIQASIDTDPFVNTGKTIQVNPINFTQADVPFLDIIVGGIVCNPEPAEITPMVTTCSGTLPSYYNPFTGVFQLRIDTNPASGCTFVVNAFTCSNLVTGNTAGLRNIQGAISPNSFVNTGKNIQVNLIELSISDLTNLNSIVSQINCAPDPIPALTTTTCGGTLPSSYLPPSGTLKLKVQNQAEVSCNFTGNTFSCPGMNVGSIVGNRDIQAAIGNSAFVNTGKSIVVTTLIFSQGDVSNLNDIIPGGINCNPNPTEVLTTINCSGTLPSYLVPPITPISLKVSGQNSVICNFTGNTFSCPGMNVGSIVGNYNIQGTIGSNQFVNTGKLITVNAISLGQDDLDNLDDLVGGINCNPNPVIVNQIISCSGTLPSTYKPPNAAFSLSVQGNPNSVCSFIGQVFTCGNMVVGGVIGVKNIQAKIGSGFAVTTGATIQVDPITLTDTDLASLNQLTGGIVCIPQVVVINSTITCSGSLPSQYVNSSSSLSLNVQGSTGSVCSFSGNNFSCTNIPTGGVFGARTIQASVANGTPVDTGKVILIQSSLAGDRFIADSDIINIGTQSRKDPFSDITCGEDDVVPGGVETICQGELITGLLLPLEFQLGIGTTPGGKCVQENTSFVCTGVPVINKDGLAILRVRVAGGDILGTNQIITVQGVNPNAGVDSGTNTAKGPVDTVVENITNLSRTGAGITVIVLTIGAACLLVLVYTPQFRKKLKIKLK